MTLYLIQIIANTQKFPYVSSLKSDSFKGSYECFVILGQNGTRILLLIYPFSNPLLKYIAQLWIMLRTAKNKVHSNFLIVATLDVQLHSVCRVERVASDLLETDIVNGYINNI